MFGISKEQLSTLPVVHYPGKPILIETVADARVALRHLMRQKIVGIDTETRPSFQKGRKYTVSLLQVATRKDCFLFRLKKIGSMDLFRRFFESEKVMKIGLSLKDDFNSLHKVGEFTPAGFVELQTFVKDYGIADNSLQKIYAVIFGERISKTQRLTNWEAPELTEPQQLYAAIDAWACLKIYKHLTGGKFDPEKCPYHLDEDPQCQHQA